MLQNARALQEDAPPERIVHRHEETRRLATALNPIIDGERPETAFLFGPSGAGETCVSKRPLEELEEEALDVTTAHVDCWDATRFELVRKVAEAAGISGSWQTTSTENLLSRLRALDDPFVVVLDEADTLRETSVLHDLWEARTVGMVVVANREAPLFAELDGRVRSRLTSGVSIRFRKYRDHELEDILADRVKWAFKCEDPREGVAPLDADQLRRIVREADGDARRAIGILRVAARFADSAGLDEITDQVIDEEAITGADEELRDQQLDQMGEDHRLLYDIVDDADEIHPNDLYEQYCEYAQDPRSDRTVRGYVRKMVDYDLLKRRGPNQERRIVVADG